MVVLFSFFGYSWDRVGTWSFFHSVIRVPCSTGTFYLHPLWWNGFRKWQRHVYIRKNRITNALGFFCQNVLVSMSFSPAAHCVWWKWYEVEFYASFFTWVFQIWILTLNKIIHFGRNMERSCRLPSYFTNECNMEADILKQQRNKLTV